MEWEAPEDGRAYRGRRSAMELWECRVDGERGWGPLGCGWHPGQPNGFLGGLVLCLELGIITSETELHRLTPAAGGRGGRALSVLA